MPAWMRVPLPGDGCGSGGLTEQRGSFAHFLSLEVNSNKAIASMILHPDFFM